MYTNNRAAYREAFYVTWQKYQKQLPLELVEQQLIQVMLAHPEYQRFLDKACQYDFEVEENPFLHMALHLSLNEQIQIDRPAGIAGIYQKLCERDEAHLVQHQMMACMGEVLWEAQQTGKLDEDTYFSKLVQLVR